MDIEYLDVSLSFIFIFVSLVVLGYQQPLTVHCSVDFSSRSTFWHTIPDWLEWLVNGSVINIRSLQDCCFYFLLNRNQTSKRFATPEASQMHCVLLKKGYALFLKV